MARYIHAITTTDLTVPNAARPVFQANLVDIPYSGYRVETLADGREVVITKPGGKRVHGQLRREDFMVWIRNPANNELWLISHAEIFEDLVAKSAANPAGTIRLIDALEQVFNGLEPDAALQGFTVEFPVGEAPELLLKAYKWIWGQEDCNYPGLKGREMSMEPIRELRAGLQQQAPAPPGTPV